MSFTPDCDNPFFTIRDNINTFRRLTTFNGVDFQIAFGSITEIVSSSWFVHKHADGWFVRLALTEILQL